MGPYSKRFLISKPGYYKQEEGCHYYDELSGVNKILDWDGASSEVNYIDG